MRSRHLRSGKGFRRVIARGERHGLRDTGRTPSKALACRPSPAYRDDREPLPARRHAPRASS